MTDDPIMLDCRAIATACLKVMHEMMPADVQSPSEICAYTMTVLDMLTSASIVGIAVSPRHADSMAELHHQHVLKNVRKLESYDDLCPG